MPATEKRQQMRVLVTSGEWQAAIAVIESLGRRGHDVWVFDPNPGLPIRCSKYCKGILQSPPEYDAGRYGQALLAELARSKYDLLVPISDHVMDVVMEHKEHIERLTGVALPDRASFGVGRNKRKTMEMALGSAIRVPRSYFTDTVQEVEALADTISYPIVVKVPVSTANTGVFIVADRQALLALFAEKKFVPDNFPFLQEFVDGDVWDVTAVCHRGTALAQFNFGASKQHLVGGTPPYMFTVDHPELIAISARIFKLLNWDGAIDLDFLVTKDHTIYLMEINPRLGGGTHFAYRVGIDLPAVYFDYVVDRNCSPRTAPNYRKYFFRTIFPAEMRWLAKKRTHIIGSLGYLIGCNTRNDIYWDDLKLPIAQLRYYRKKRS